MRIFGITSLIYTIFDIVFHLGIFISDNPISALNQKLHSSSLYNGFQMAINAVAIFSGSFAKAMPKAVCFVAGTTILTARGCVAIERIQVGDKVISTNVDTLEITEKTVLQTFVRKSWSLVHLWMDGKKTSVTPNHPYWVPAKGWVDAGELASTEQLQKPDGSLTSIQKVEHEERDALVSVYNFEVEEFHTYYAGNVCVLVHNADYPDAGGSGARGTGKSLSELLDDVKSERIKLQGLSGDDQIKIANQLRLNSPIEIPDNITPTIDYKNGYEQVTFKWSDGTYTYEVRWHTATPNAPPGTPPNWRVDRIIPGFAGGRDPVTRAKIQGYSAIEEVLIVPPNAKPYYMNKDVWNTISAAYRNGSATQAQKEILKWGHLITD